MKERLEELIELEKKGLKTALLAKGRAEVELRAMTPELLDARIKVLGLEGKQKRLEHELDDCNREIAARSSGLAALTKVLGHLKKSQQKAAG